VASDITDISHQIDHVVSRKYGGSFGFENLAYACVLCNRHKGRDAAAINPNTGQVVPLFHPRRDRWTDHFRIEADCIEPITEVGAATVRLLRLNAADGVAEGRVLGLRALRSAKPVWATEIW
jgi:HNH endonuclease